MSTKLAVYRREKIDLIDALSAFAGISSLPAVALLYAPERCMLATFSQAALLGSEDERLDASTVYEARIFHEEAELRWWNDPSGQAHHLAVVLVENESLHLDGWHCLKTPPLADTLSQTYVLWGEGTGRCTVGWSELATARIGRLMVPVANVGKHERVVLRTREYIAREQEHGNAFRIDERLMKLEVCRG